MLLRRWLIASYERPTLCTTEILARDERLVKLLRAGRFDALMKNVDDSTRHWAARVLMGTQV